MYDVGSWKWQYKKDGNEAWQNDTLALPRLEKGQLAEIKLSYKDNGLEIDVNGTKATVTEANLSLLKTFRVKSESEARHSEMHTQTFILMMLL